MKLISLFLVLAAEIFTKRGYWLALILIDSKYKKKAGDGGWSQQVVRRPLFFCKYLF
jgi:hypothetical protein